MNNSFKRPQPDVSFGLLLRGRSDAAIRTEIARLALTIPKIRAASQAWELSNSDENIKFEEALAPVLVAIRSDSYRALAVSLLKSWARFIDEELSGSVKS